MDYRKPRASGQKIDGDDEKLKVVYVYDHNYAQKGLGMGGSKSAKAESPKSGIRMNVYTDLPGLQFYAGNTTRDIIGKGGVLITKNSGFCMESHYYAKSIITSNFTQPMPDKGGLYKTTTIYQFT